jgi:DNA-directed RNA polymerase specialized sigma24 family protein
MSDTSTNAVQPYPDWKPYEEDFVFNDSIWDSDDERIRHIKWVIDNKLSVGEREIFILYAHNNSNYRKLSRLLGCSATTARNRISQIRKKIIENL